VYMFLFYLQHSSQKLTDFSSIILNPSEPDYPLINKILTIFLI